MTTTAQMQDYFVLPFAGTVLFTIHTEWRSNLAELVAREFTEFSIFEGMGYWRGFPERCARIDIIADVEARATVERLAKTIRETNTQETVLVSETAIVLTEIAAL